MSRVLVVQTAHLGDVVLTIPLLRELSRLAPASDLTVVANATGVELLRHSGLCARLVPLSKGVRPSSLLSLVRLARELRREGCDVAIAAQRSHRSGLLLRLSGAPRRIGFAGAPGAWSYTERIDWAPERHAVERYLALAPPLLDPGRNVDPAPRLRPTPESRDRAAQLVEEAGIASGETVVCLAPGSRWGTKRWPAEGYAEVARALQDRGLRPLLVGSPDESELCRRVAKLSGRDLPSIAGGTGIGELAALLERSAALVANDSGPAHVAAAVGRPVVSIFGPTVPAMGYVPFGSRHRIVEHPGLDCRPCDHHGPRRCPLGHFRCMREIDAASVVSALEQVLAGEPRDRE